jgi:hypothetical protein
MSGNTKSRNIPVQVVLLSFSLPVVEGPLPDLPLPSPNSFKELYSLTDLALLQVKISLRLRNNRKAVIMVKVISLTMEETIRRVLPKILLIILMEVMIFPLILLNLLAHRAHPVVVVVVDLPVPPMIPVMVVVVVVDRPVDLPAVVLVT